MKDNAAPPPKGSGPIDSAVNHPLHVLGTKTTDHVGDSNNSVEEGTDPLPLAAVTNKGATTTMEGVIQAQEITMTLVILLPKSLTC